MLPQVVEAASAPMSAIDKMTVISTDGASSLTKSVAANVAQGLQLGTDLTGIDLPGLLARLGADGPTPPRRPPGSTLWTAAPSRAEPERPADVRAGRTG